MTYTWGYRLPDDHPARRRWAEARADGWDLRVRVLDALAERPLNKDQLHQRLISDRCPGWSLQYHWDQLDHILNDLAMDAQVVRVTREQAVQAGGRCETEQDTWWSWWMRAEPEPQAEP